MRILVIADAGLTVPPQRYGGTERMVASLCDGFAARGHEVVLMAAEGSTASGRLVTHRRCDDSSLASRAFRKIWFQPLSLAAARGCDVILNAGRTDYLHGLLATRIPLAVRFDTPIGQSDVDFLTRRRPGSDLVMISISQNQRSAVHGGNWTLIHNGIDTRVHRPKVDVGTHLAFLGRLAPEKGIEAAIRVAREAGLPLRIGGNVPDRDYFDSRVRPGLTDDVEYLGELDQFECRELLASSSALLFPVWSPEAFGLVVVEALACGTPVVAARSGPTPELLVDGVTGFLCGSEAEMVRAVARVGEIDRAACRQDAVARFSSDRMVEGHLRALESVAGS